jgi:hypothetical protein
MASYLVSSKHLDTIRLRFAYLLEKADMAVACVITKPEHGYVSRCSPARQTLLSLAPNARAPAAVRKTL